MEKIVLIEFEKVSKLKKAQRVVYDKYEVKGEVNIPPQSRWL